MSTNEDEASVRSRESVGSQRTMCDTVSSKGDTERRKTACTWAQGEQALEGKQERIRAGVLAQSMEGDGMDSLWRVMNVIKGGHCSQEEAKKVRDRVVATVEERWKAGELKEQLPPGQTGWQVYIQKMVQGKRIGGAPEVKAGAEGGGYKVTVYRETKDGLGYRKIKGYGEQSGKRAGISWKKTRVSAATWEKEGEGTGSAAGEGGDHENGRGAATRAIAGSDREQSVASNDSRPSTCGAASVRSAEGNDVEQQRKAARAWKRREDALEGARERTRDRVLVEHMDGRMSTPYGPCCVRWRAGRMVRKS